VPTAPVKRARSTHAARAGAKRELDQVFIIFPGGPPGGGRRVVGRSALADRARRPRFSRPPAAELELAIQDALEQDEVVLFSLGGIGSTMVGTNRRVMVARDGVGFRPRSGIRSFDIGAIQTVTVDGNGRSSGRIVLRLGPLYYQAVSMFFEASQASAAVEAARHLRLAIARRREEDRRRAIGSG
jgi:hypothetical protein